MAGSASAPLISMPSAPLCGHSIERGSMTYENPDRPLWRRILRPATVPATFTYCRPCAAAFRRLFDGYWAGTLSLAAVEVGLRELNIHENERELRRTLRALRRAPNYG